MANRFSARGVGLFSIWWQFLWTVVVLAMALMVYFSVGHANLIYVLLAAIVLSRLGLWGFDVVEVQLMLELVPIQYSNQIFGVEFSLLSFLSILPLLCGLFLRDPIYFVWLILACTVVIGLAALSFTVWRILGS
jgi:hypothetical protein